MRVIIFLAVFGYAQSKLHNLSCNDIRAFVNGHYNRRASLAKGQVAGQPAATNMKYMVWDEELANKAAAWASKSRYQHNPDRNVGSRRFRTGENLFLYSTTDFNHRFNIDHALKSWFDEYKDYKFGPFQSPGRASPKIGHYTQMVWADTTYVGCAISQYRDGKWMRFLVVCNYGPAGNVIGRLPYNSGRRGSGRLTCSIGNNNCKKLYGRQCQSG